MRLRKLLARRLTLGARAVALGVLLAGCAAAPAAPAPTAPPQPTATSAPTAAPQPTSTPAPTAAPPTAPPTATSAPTEAPTSAPATGTPAPAARSFVVYQPDDGSLRMIAGPGAPPIVLADPTEPAAQLPWAASPDGKTIAIVTGKGLWYQFSAPVSLALWLVSSDGTNARKIQDLLPPRGVDLTPGGDDAFNLVPALTSEQRLAWSPDGALVAFVSAHEGQVDLYSAALDGTVARLTDTPALEQGPAWSPDGALVAYRTTSGFGTGAGWGDIALAVSARGGGPPVFESSDRALAAGTQAAAIPDLLWLSPTLLVAGLWDSVAGSSEVRALDVAARTARVIFDAPYSALAWNGTTGQLAIAGTSAQLIKRPIDGRKLAPGLFTWSPAAEQPTQIEPQPVERLAWTPQGDALAYSVAGAKPELRIWSIGAEGDVKPIAGAAAERLSWSPDGQRLAADMSAYSRAGQVLLDRAGQPGLQIGWTNQGLVYARNDGGSAFDLLVWDGAADQPLARQIAKPMAAGVVNPAP